MVTQALLELYTVAICYGNVVHVHTEHQAAYVVSISNTCSYASPCSNLLLSLFALPVTYNYLSRDAHTGADVTELDVAVSRLVEVHEVHVDRIPREFCVILSVEVEERLLESLQALDPHLSWREGVHPCDDTYALLIVVGCLHDSLYFCRRVSCALVNYLDWDDATVVQTIYHVL